MMQQNKIKAQELFANHMSEPYNKEISSIELISSGFTNQSFKITNIQNAEFQVRIGNTKIDRNNEQLILDALDNHGDFIYYDAKTGNAIRKWAKGHNPSIEECRSELFLKEFSKELNQLHQLEVNTKITKRDFFIFETISDFSGLEHQLERYRQIINQYKSLPLVISHNDLRPDNLVWDGKKLVIIDYEWGTLNNRYWDLANFLREIKYPLDNLKNMLDTHFQWADYEMIKEFLFACTFFAYQWTFFPEESDAILDYRKDAKKLMTQYFELITK